MITLSSIAAVDKVYETMSRPFRVLCQDYKHYIAKFGRGHDLFNEYISAKFCRCWEIPTPECAIINLIPGHLPKGYNRSSFNYTGFGSEFLEHSLELSQFLLTWKDNQYDIGRIVNKDDFLKIGLFDLWISNEDRNHNNANLLINPSHDGYYFIAIDHVNIFNTGNLEKGLAHLTQDESILYSDYVTLLFKNSEKTRSAIEKIEKSFETYIERCQASLPEILDSVPKDWKIDIPLQRRLLEQLFLTEWKQETLRNFRLYIANNFS